MASTPVEVRRFRGAEVRPWLQSLAALRIAVFAEWPYLYDGDAAYEAEYLATYARSPDSVFVLALAEGEVVGASTGVPLEDEVEAFRAPLRACGIEPATVFYFGESVLLPRWRGRGLGHRFFDEREAFARSLGRFRHAAFCSVVRDLGDPRRPGEYRSLEPFWRKRGYAPLDGAVATLEWKETWHTHASEHRLQFWLRDLATAADPVPAGG